MGSEMCIRDSTRTGQLRQADTRPTYSATVIHSDAEDTTTATLPRGSTLSQPAKVCVILKQHRDGYADSTVGCCWAILHTDWRGRKECLVKRLYLTPAMALCYHYPTAKLVAAILAEAQAQAATYIRLSHQCIERSQVQSLMVTTYGPEGGSFLSGGRADIATMVRHIPKPPRRADKETDRNVTNPAASMAELQRQDEDLFHDFDEVTDQLLEGGTGDLGADDGQVMTPEVTGLGDQGGVLLSLIHI